MAGFILEEREERHLRPGLLLSRSRITFSQIEPCKDLSSYVPYHIFIIFTSLQPKVYRTPRIVGRWI
jgi:hypothetical protein